MKLKKEWLAIGALVLLLLAGTGIILFITLGNKTEKADAGVLAAKTDIEEFQNIPTMSGANITYSEAVDVGSDNYMIQADNTTLDEYRAYLKTLENAGYKKQVDNGEDGIEKNVYAAYYQKDKSTVHVSYMSKLEKTMINVTEKPRMSEHLFYNESYVAGNAEGAKTKLHFQELYEVGNNFIFQLKDGTFIVEDGGAGNQLPYLLDYLEELAPEGQKPTIIAWFVSHSHLDHMGVFRALSDNKEACARINVEGVYYNAPSKAAQISPAGTYDSVNVTTTMSAAAGAFLKNTEGKNTPVYRTQLGDRYYFNDITIDVIYSQELIDSAEWDTWNSSSSIYMHTIEGQKVMFNGDADIACQELVMDMYDREYLDIDIYQVAHHGFNVLREIPGYYTRIDTLLYPTWRFPNVAAEGAFLARTIQNQYLREFAKEELSWQDGTLVLSFPYEIGSAEKLDPIVWKYNDAEPTWKERLAQERAAALEQQ